MEKLLEQQDSPIKKTLYANYLMEIRTLVEYLPTLTVSRNRFEKIKKEVKEIESRYPDQKYKVHFVELDTDSQVSISLTHLAKFKKVRSESKIKELAESLPIKWPLLKDLLNDPCLYDYYQEASEKRIYISYNDSETNKAIREQFNLGIGVVILAKNHSFTIRRGTKKKVNRLEIQKNTFKLDNNTFVVLPPDIVAIYRMLNY